MEKFLTLKNAISLLVTAGVGTVIDDAIDATAPPEVKLPAKILRKIGSWSLSWFIGDWAGEKAEQAYDTMTEAVKQVSDKVKEVNEAANDISKAATEEVAEAV